MTGRVLILASDLHEASQRKTILGLKAAGWTVESASFKRGNMAPAAVDWPDLDLGAVGNGVTLARWLGLLRAMWRLTRARQRVRGVDRIVARNLDMALLGLWARFCAGRRVPLIYQCLDIHGSLIGSGFRARLARWVERRVLARCASLVISAPGFIDHYFQPVQRYDGPVQLLENRILWAATAPPRNPNYIRQQRPVTLGWVGTLRCPQSFALLAEVARQCGPNMRVEMHGAVHHHQLPNFDRTLARIPALTWHGPYAYPDGLAAIYARLTCVWGQDLWQSGANSDWLLPNRVYEAGYFGCPLLAVEGTATAQRVAQYGSGIVLSRPSAPEVLQALSNPRALDAARAALLAMPGSAFAQTPWTMARVLLGPTDKGRRYDPVVESVLGPAE